MDILCPFFRENCHGNECVMWKNEKCLVVSYLEGVSLDEEDVVMGEETEDEGETSGARVPKWLKALTPEELAVEMLDFKRKEFSEEDNMYFSSLSHLFWGSKDVDMRYPLPLKIQLKIDKANHLAERQITLEEEAKEKKKMSEEKEELPSLVSKFLEWARIKGLRRLERADADTFIMEKDLDLSYQSQRTLYLMAKEALKKKRFGEEKEELPSLVGKCVDWARINSLKRLALADVDSFVMEKELDLLKETKRAMSSMANLKLKSRQ